MPYADTNFFLAFLKKNDWLNFNAKKLLEKYKDDIWTSEWTIIEIFMLSEKFGIDPETAVISIKEFARIEGNSDFLMSVAHTMKEKNMNTFDALHAISCGKDKIISSDGIFDGIGLERIKLEADIDSRDKDRNK